MSDVVQTGVHNFTAVDKYVKPDSKVIQDKIEWFKDMKIGYMMHFGVFNQIGFVESWALSDEVDGDYWSHEGIDWTSVKNFKNEYVNLNKTFNPLRLDPERSANFIKNLGFEYVILPTKHHDGFCMWDTKQTDYKVTHLDCAYSVNKNADIFKALTCEFHKLNMPVGAYFSKPDWNCKDYWDEDVLKGVTEHNVSYSVKDNPKKWNDFVEFTHNQFREIVLGYAPIDILWLDGGWVRANNLGQDLKLDKIIPELRETKEDLLVVDRTCGGEFENYATPEQTIPSEYLPIPWESCISLGPPFAYDYNDKYKTPNQLCDIFIEVLGKNGNLVLNLAPSPDGRLPQDGCIVLTEFMSWLTSNEKAIKYTRPIEPYFAKKIAYTTNQNGDMFMIRGNRPNKTIDKLVYLHTDKKITSLKLVDGDIDLEFKQFDTKIEVVMPKEIVDRKAPLAYAFKYTC